MYTSDKETPLIFNTREDFAFAMNVVAQAYASSEINILAFEIMGNKTYDFIINWFTLFYIVHKSIFVIQHHFSTTI